MKKTKELILIHKEMPHAVNIPTGGIDILLTPQFYTVKHEEIPVEYTYQAKRIAPSLFEGLLEDIENYRYFVFKDKGVWVCIAYNLDAIKTFLEHKGFSTEQIAKIYFADQMTSDFVSPLLLGKSDALANLNGIMTVVPQAALSAEEEPMDLSALSLPNKGVSFEGSSNTFISSNHAYALAALVLVFAGVYFIEATRYGGENKAEQQEIQTLLEAHPSLQSSYSRESISKKYQDIDSKERKKRDIIKSLSQMIFKGSTLSSLIINDKKFKAEFLCSDNKVKTKLEELAKKELFNTSNVAKDNMITIEGIL